MKGWGILMANITVKLVVDGVEQVLTPKSVLNNVELDMATAKEYLIKSGLYTAEQLTTDDDIVTAFWDTYCNDRFALIDENAGYRSYYTSDDDRLALPYPFGNKSILSLGIGLYNDSSEHATSFISAKPISFTICGSITKSDTECSYTKTITDISGVFNKISLFGNFVIDPNFTGYRMFHGWSESNISKLSTAVGGMLYNLNGAYYLFVKGNSSKSTTGVYAMTDISNISQSTKFKHDGYTFGGIYDGKPFLCDKSEDGADVYGDVIEYDSESGTFYSSSQSLWSDVIYGGDTLYAVYAFTNSNFIALVDDGSSVDLVLYGLDSDGFGTAITVNVTYSDTSDYDLHKSFITMIDGVLYLIMSYGGCNEISRIDTDTGDYTTATEMHLTGLKTFSSDGVYPCNNGSWYFSDTSQIVELTPDIPLLEIELEQPIDATSGTCSVELNITISKGDNG